MGCDPPVLPPHLPAPQAPGQVEPVPAVADPCQERRQGASGTGPTARDAGREIRRQLPALDRVDQQEPIRIAAGVDDLDLVQGEAAAQHVPQHGADLGLHPDRAPQADSLAVGLPQTLGEKPTPGCHLDGSRGRRGRWSEPAGRWGALIPDPQMVEEQIPLHECGGPGLRGRRPAPLGPGGAPLSLARDRGCCPARRCAVGGGRHAVSVAPDAMQPVPGDGACVSMGQRRHLGLVGDHPHHRRMRVPILHRVDGGPQDAGVVPPVLGQELVAVGRVEGGQTGEGRLRGQPVDLPGGRLGLAQLVEGAPQGLRQAGPGSPRGGAHALTGRSGEDRLDEASASLLVEPPPPCRRLCRTNALPGMLHGGGDAQVGPGAAGPRQGSRQVVPVPGGGNEEDLRLQGVGAAQLVELPQGIRDHLTHL